MGALLPGFLAKPSAAPIQTNPLDDEFSIGGTKATVPTGGFINVVIMENNGTWKATEWVFRKTTDLDRTFACVEIVDENGKPKPFIGNKDANPRTHAFTITVPDGPDVVGSYDLTIIIHPNKGCQGTNVDTLTLLSGFGVDNFPVAVDDTYSTNEDTALKVTARNVAVLANDTDVDPGDTKTVTEVNGISAAVGNTIKLPSFGALLTLQADGSFDYDPIGHFD